MKCNHCDKECKNPNAHRNHERLCKLNPNRQQTAIISYNQEVGNSNKIPWNKGLSKHTDSRINQHSIALAEKYKTGELVRPSFTDEQRNDLSTRAKKNGLGGYRPHPNRGSYYNGTWFDSNWEVQVAKSLDNANVKWSRPKIGFVWNDKGNKYYPDFYLEEYGIYLDPKNPYLIKKDNTKITEAQTRNNIRVMVLTEDQLEWAVIKTLL